jgi:2-polyprenyl-6-methoxyphenol hydroxylase-like FAD-dependent oxidoreductase
MVVIGSSLAGSSVATALSPYLERVVVLERDGLTDEAIRRKGTPHAQQFHTLTAGGRSDFEELFPGLTADISAAGAPLADSILTAAYSPKFGWFPRQPPDMLLLQVTRSYLEWYMRKRTVALPNVTLLDDTRAVGLVFEGGAVTGVRVRGGETGEERVISADLVVDATGRSSMTPRWLAESGFDRPVETPVNARWGYATVYVRVPDAYDPGWASLYIGPTVTGEGLAATRGAAMWFQEDNLMVVTAQGCAGDLPPNTFEGFLDYMSSSGRSEFRDLIEEYGAVSQVEIWRNTSNVKRDYWDVQRRPENLVAVGDAVVAFNPIYGQGMTVAAQSAKVLRAALSRFLAEHLDGDLTGFAAAYFEDVKALVEPCWEFSTASDFNVPGVEANGEKQEQARNPAANYADRLLALATEDPTVSKKMFETSHMVRGIEWMADEDLVAGSSRTGPTRDRDAILLAELR